MAVFSTSDNSPRFTKPPKKDLDLDELFKTSTNKNPKQYTFTNNWFEKQRPIVDKILTTVLDSTKSIRILEIGCYEGRSTVHYIDNHLSHSNSTIVSIDPFSTEDLTSPVTNTTKEIFENNIKLSKFPNKSKIVVGYSQDVLAHFICERKVFDYIVVDGSHLSKDSLLDACMSFQLLAPNGVMFFDDYLGGNDDRDTNINYPKFGIDSFLKSYKDHYKVIHSGYHFAIQKIEPTNVNKRRIFDCFLFNNEIDMLKLRLEELKDVVDIFVLVESKYTFSGKDKPLHFELVKDEFLKYNIQYITLTEPPAEDAWSNEAFQRNAPLEYLKQNMLPDDVALLCDLDEIPNSAAVQDIRNKTIPVPIYFHMDFYYYNFNWIKKSPWMRASAVTLDTLLKYDIEQIRNLQAGISNAAQPGGWHLSYFMSPESIREKIKAFSHQEFNKEQYLDLDSITAAINSGKDLFSRGDHEDLIPWHGQILPKNKDIINLK
jgi:beta-1,4-mannosyl-glycoprotein beta-1,4-N-acetylglucosaminyltransferase